MIWGCETRLLPEKTSDDQTDAKHGGTCHLRIFCVFSWNKRSRERLKMHADRLPKGSESNLRHPRLGSTLPSSTNSIRFFCVLSCPSLLLGVPSACKPFTTRSEYRVDWPSLSWFTSHGHSSAGTMMTKFAGFRPKRMLHRIHVRCAKSRI